MIGPIKPLSFFSGSSMDIVSHAVNVHSCNECRVILIRCVQNERGFYALTHLAMFVRIIADRIDDGSFVIVGTPGRDMKQVCIMGLVVIEKGKIKLLTVGVRSG